MSETKPHLTIVENDYHDLGWFTIEIDPFGKGGRTIYSSSSKVAGSRHLVQDAITHVIWDVTGDTQKD